MKRLIVFFCVMALFFQVSRAYASNPVIARAKLKQEPVYNYIPAQIISKTSITISSKITGLINSLKVDIGDRVKKGEVLLSINKLTTKQNVRQAVENVKRARAQLKNAEFNYRRFLNLYESKVVSQQKFMSMKTLYEVAKSSYKQAISRLKIAQTTLNYYSVIKSPINGVVSEKYVYNGDMAAMYQHLIKISSLKNLQVRADIDLDTLNHVKSHKWVKIKVNNAVLKVKLTHVSLVSDPITRTFEIKADLPPNINANPGEFAYLIVKIKTKPTIVIDKRAITVRGGMNGVFVVNNKGRTQFRIVRLGKKYGNNIEVLSGIFPKEKVVLNPPLYLKNNSLITNEKQ